ncbi:hypothetical protein BZG36_05444 [Bifiguratus adelaidae]|uniref:Crinkler effector protein N-terminal domain-containing protein n=1 Tax=Bifiguratus adelaidae TaxID=1938954 RepID=A0A261XTM1_9FUNG|nr:hypothetical protein BZG36_05444 [Bifiguratus adelaidae]
MEVDEYRLELNFILLNGETAYKDATMAFKITLSSTANTWDIREAVQQKCTQCNVPFEDIRLDKLDVYKAGLSPSESNALLQEIKSGRRIANSEWKTSLLDDLGLLSDYFTKQPDKRAIHLIVDCTDALLHNSEHLQRGDGKMDISADLPESEGLTSDNVITLTPSRSQERERQRKAREQERIKRLLDWTPRLGGEGGTIKDEQDMSNGFDELEGIEIKDEQSFIDRRAKVDQLYDTLGKAIVVLIRCPPMGGKTSFVQLLERKVLREQVTVYKGKLRVFRISTLWFRTSNPDWIFTEEFEYLMGGLSWKEFIRECDYINTLLIIDEAQADNSYHGGQALWNKVKPAQQFRRPKIALFSTYGYGAAHGKQSDAVISPIRVSETWGLQELQYTREEYDQYVQMTFQGHLMRALVATDLPDLSNQVWDLTLGLPVRRRWDGHRGQVIRRCKATSSQRQSLKHISMGLLHRPADDLALEIRNQNAEEVMHAFYYTYIEKGDENELIDVNEAAFQMALDDTAPVCKKLQVFQLQTGYKYYVTYRWTGADPFHR